MQDSDNKSFALFDDVASVVGDDLASTSGITDLFNDLDGSPDEFLDEPKEFSRKEDEPDDFSDLDLSAGTLDKSNDSVRVYLREMGMVPLLTREGEIELAKRIEHGEAAVRKALSRSRLILHILLELRQRVEEGSYTPLEVLQTPDAVNEEGEDVVSPQREQLLELLNTLDRHYRRSQQLDQKLASMTRNIRPKPYRKLRYEYMRLLVTLSRHVRTMPFSSRFQRSLTKELKNAVDQLRPLEHEIARLQRKLENPALEKSVAAAGVRKELKTLASQVESLEARWGSSAASFAGLCRLSSAAKRKPKRRRSGSSKPICAWLSPLRSVIPIAACSSSI